MIERMIDARSRGRSGLLGLVDEQHRQLALALQRAQIPDRHPFVLGQSHR